ncbi:DUF3592 domain-containing protein [Streptomyces sp. MAG02]|nr:DUF3592 domain-containing protein [Streptomyces sp. MAG02]
MVVTMAVIWVAVHLMLFGLVMYPFGLRPIFVKRRLLAVGVRTKATCVSSYWSEDRVSERFNFTVDGFTFSHSSSLRWSRIASDGETVEIVYDPKRPSRARTVRELNGRTEVRFMIIGSLVAMVCFNLFYIKAFIGLFQYLFGG